MTRLFAFCRFLAGWAPWRRRPAEINAPEELWPSRATIERLVGPVPVWQAEIVLRRTISAGGVDYWLK